MCCTTDELTSSCLSGAAPDASISKRKRTRPADSRRIQFAPEMTQIKMIEKIADAYSQRYLWYNRQELQRNHVMDLRRNLVASGLVDTAMGAPDLTWRGMEQHKPGHVGSNNARAHAWEVVQRAKTCCSPEELGHVAESLSWHDRLQARQRGMQDEESVNGVETTITEQTSLLSTTSHVGLKLAIHQVSALGSFVWVMRVITYCLICGLVLAAKPANEGSSVFSK